LEGRKQGLLEWRFAWRGASRACLNGATLGGRKRGLLEGRFAWEGASGAYLNGASLEKKGALALPSQGRQPALIK